MKIMKFNDKENILKAAKRKISYHLDGGFKTLRVYGLSQIMDGESRGITYSNKQINKQRKR